MRLWEIHPMLVAFPIAFLLGGLVLDLYAAARKTSRRVATGLFAAGFWTGIAAAAAGLVAFFTVPAHTAEAHTLMYWHLGLSLGSLALFGGVLWARRRARDKEPSRGQTLVAILAGALLAVGADLGGRLVFRGGAGVDPDLLAPHVRADHSHGTEPEEAHGHDSNDHEHGMDEPKER